MSQLERRSRKNTAQVGVPLLIRSAVFLAHLENVFPTIVIARSLSSLISTLSTRFLGAALWSISSAVVARLIGLVTEIAIGRLLGRVEFGQVGVIQSTVAAFGVVGGCGVGMTVTKHVAELRGINPERAGRIVAAAMTVSLTLSALAGILLAIAAPWLSRQVLAEPALASVLPIGAALLVLETINAAQVGVLNGLEKFGQSAKVAALSSMLGLPIGVVGASYGGVSGYLWALVANRSCNAILNYRALREHRILKGIKISYRDLMADFAVVKGFSLSLAASGIGLAGSGWVCNAILVRQQGGYAEMGLFTAATNWRSLIFFLPFTISSVYLPIATNCWGECKAADFKRAIVTNIILNVTLTVAVALPVCLLAAPIMRSYGEAYEQGRFALVLLATSCVMLALDYATANFLIAKGQTWRLLAYNLIMGVTSIGLTWWFVVWRGWGAIGLALSILIAQTIKASLQSAQLRRL